MSTLFSRIVAGEIPGRFVWADDRCVSFLTIAPLTRGHAMVVPRVEVDQWVDADDDLLAHLLAVARRIGTAQREEFEARRIGLLVEGYEVPHLHVHVWPTQDPADFEVHRVDHDPDPEVLDAAGERLRSRLVAQGHETFVPARMDSPRL